MVDSESIAIICSVVVTLAFSVSNVLWKTPVRLIGPQKTIFIRNIFTTAILGTVYIVSPGKKAFELYPVAMGIGLSAVSYFGLFFFNKAQQKGDVAVTVPIATLHSFITSILAIFLLGEHMPGSRATGMLVSFTGILFVVFDFRKFNFKSFNIYEPGIIPALLAAFFWGITYTFFGMASKNLGVELFSFVLEATILAMSGFHLLFTKTTGTESGKLKRSFLWLLGIALCGSVGVFCTNLSFSLVPVTSVEFFASIGYLLPIVAGRYIYKEKITLQKWFGLSLIIGGLIIGKLF